MQDWLTLMTKRRDMTNFNDLRTLTTRAELDLRDPQRSIFYLPTDVAPYQNDMNPASATYRLATVRTLGPTAVRSRISFTGFAAGRRW